VNLMPRPGEKSSDHWSKFFSELLILLLSSLVQVKTLSLSHYFLVSLFLSFSLSFSLSLSLSLLSLLSLFSLSFDDASFSKTTINPPSQDVRQGSPKFIRQAYLHQTLNVASNALSKLLPADRERTLEHFNRVVWRWKLVKCYVWR